VIAGHRHLQFVLHARAGIADGEGARVMVVDVTEKERRLVLDVVIPIVALLLEKFHDAREDTRIGSGICSFWVRNG